MDQLTNNLILYNNGKHFDVLEEVSLIYAKYNDCVDIEHIKKDINKVSGKLLDIAMNYGIVGNVWHGYIALLLMTSENAFTRMCEMRMVQDTTVCEFAKLDIDKLFDAYNCDFTDIELHVGTHVFSMLKNYNSDVSQRFVRYKNVSKLLNEFIRLLEKTNNNVDFYNAIVDFYSKYGFGDLGLNRSFIISSGGNLNLRPVNEMENVQFGDIVGYEEQKRLLIDNTRAFIDGKSANNVLLYGDSGTGKSTSIKAVINEFYAYGLRMIEVHKHQIEKLSSLISELKYRNYKFIIYMDDLSFEENENEYKYLKAVIEGGVETKPDNVLIYATSNRRHLVRETWNDRDGISARNDVHSSDTIEEKLSLAARFGLTIYYPKPARAQYTDIVIELASRVGINMSNEELESKARVWEMHHGGISGRTAKQFIISLLNEQ